MAKISLSQLEALFWVIELGTFNRAAARLNTTQSTISKRIQELEHATGLTLFDRSRRGARVSEKGEQLYEHARDMLKLQDRVMALREGEHVPQRLMRLGVTELTVLTWMPAFTTHLREAYPELIIEPTVDMSRSLYEGLLEGRLDAIIVPEAIVDKDIRVFRLAEVQNAWLAHPDFLRSDAPFTLNEICAQPIIMQGSRSGASVFFIRWLKGRGAMLENPLHADSMMATVALALAGFGIAYLPRPMFDGMINEKKLVEIPSSPKLPTMSYSLVFRRDLPSAFFDQIAVLARKSCDFSGRTRL